MRIEITAVHRHDGWSCNSRDFIGSTGEATEIKNALGTPGWSSLSFVPDANQPCSKHLRCRSNTVFYAVKFKKLPKDAGE